MFYLDQAGFKLRDLPLPLNDWNIFPGGVEQWKGTGNGGLKYLGPADWKGQVGLGRRRTDLNLPRCDAPAA